eukprot:g15953.t1
MDVAVGSASNPLGWDVPMFLRLSQVLDSVSQVLDTAAESRHSPPRFGASASICSIWRHRRESSVSVDQPASDGESSLRGGQGVGAGAGLFVTEDKRVTNQAAHPPEKTPTNTKAVKRHLPRRSASAIVYAVLEFTGTAVDLLRAALALLWGCG